MARTYHTTQGDVEPIARQLTRNGEPADLTGRNVSFIARHEDGVKAVDDFATVVNATAGYVSYTLSSTQTAKAGAYEVEWVVSGGASDPTTFPATEAETLIIREDVELDDAVAEELPPDRTVDQLNVNELNGGVTSDQPLTDFVGGNLSLTNGVLDAELADYLRTDEDAVIEHAGSVSLTIQSTETGTFAEELFFGEGGGDWGTFLRYLNDPNLFEIVTYNSNQVPAENTALSVDRDTQNVDIPNGTLSEAGNAVATQTWVDTSADVPNADHADAADSATAADAVVDEAAALNRQLFVIENGAADPASAGAEDIIFEKEV